jgi:DNA-directed RNA polymerase subunit RPC12/RpoP
MDESLPCDTCGREVDRSEATRTATYGNLDSDRWQTLCCPDCGSRLKTVFVRADG